jgi:hypothetical protein
MATDRQSRLSETGSNVVKGLKDRGDELRQGETRLFLYNGLSVTLL